MPEYISREAVENMLLRKAMRYEAYKETQAAIAINEARICLTDIPAADFVEVTHGEWIETGESPDEGNNWDYICNRCGHKDTHAKNVVVHYCWFCGARMDGDNNHA